MTRNSLANVVTSNVLVLVAVLPLLVPFGLSKNITLQAVVITLTGTLAWLVVLLRDHWHNDLIHFLLATYAAACVMSLLAHFSGVNAIGTPLVRLGSLELLACLGIGLSLRRVPFWQLALTLYASISVLAIVSMPYALVHIHHWVRIGGLLFQPDFLAAVVAVGLLIGCSLWQHYPRYRFAIAVLQVCLVSTLFLTQTRAVIALLLAILLMQIVCSRSSLVLKAVTIGALLVLTMVGVLAVKPLTTGRLSDTKFASQSIAYRVELQKLGVRRLADEPLAGYGNGNLQKPLACDRIQAAALYETCHSGYYFDSTHNVFLDRFLGIGWFGGLSLVFVSSLLLYRGLQQPDRRLLSFCALLITLYYYTNVAFIEIEMLYWICLLHTGVYTEFEKPLDKHKRLPI